MKQSYKLDTSDYDEFNPVRKSVKKRRVERKSRNGWVHDDDD